MTKFSKSNTLVYAVVLALCAAMLVWLWFGGGNDVINQSSSSEESRNSQLGSHHTPRPSQSVSRKEREKHQAVDIDADERLAALYLRYPSLAIESKTITPEHLDLLKSLFPIGEKEALDNEIERFQAMVSGDQEWDPIAAQHFLTDNRERLRQLDPIIVETNNYSGATFTELRPLQKLITTSYILNLKLGNAPEANRQLKRLRRLTINTQSTDLLHSSFSIASSLEIAGYQHSLFSEQPDLVFRHVREKNHAPDFTQVLTGEFSGSMRLVYSSATVEIGGELYVDLSEALNAPHKTLIPLSQAEDLIAQNYHTRTTYMKECKDFEEYISGEEMDAELKKIISDNDKLSEEERLLLDALWIGSGYYYESYRAAQLQQQTQNTAIQIAYAQHQGQEWTGTLPLNFKTGEPIIWDKENHQLHTGLENENATIDIPLVE